MNSFYYDYGNFTVNGVELPWVQADSGWVRPSAGQRSRESAVLNQTGVNGWAGAPAPYRRSEDVRLSTWNARGTHTDVAVDRFGNPTLVEAPLGLVTTIERDAVTGLPTLVKSTAGSQATYRWDERGNLLYAIDPRSGVATVTEYDPVFDLPKRVQRGRGVLRYRYGAQGELLSATMSGDSTVYTYDTRGRLRTSEDMGGHEVQITYEPGGFQNTATVTRPGANGPQTDTYAYDGYGRTRAVRAANGDSTAVAYDVLNRRISATDPAGRTTTFGYTREHLTRVTDPTGQSYFSRVNALGWKQADSIPGRPNAYLGYDRLGNVTSATDRRGSTVTVTHDALGRVLTRTADGQTTTYAYDNPNNRWIAAANAESTDTLYYDESHRLRSKVSVLGANRYELRYAHTVEGTLLSVSLNTTLAQGVALTRSVTYRPDGRLRPYAIEDLSGQETTIRFNADGQASSITFPTGLQQTFTYTPSHLPETANWNNGTVQASLGASYTYDLRDRLVAGPQRGPAANRTQRTYQYDRSNQLIGFQDQSITTRTVCSPLPCRIVVDTTTSHMPSESYSYDHAGNRTDRGAMLEPGSNRYATFDNYLFQYDNEGNLLRKVKPGYDDLTLTWNSLGQVASASRYQRGTVQYGYNGFGERVRRTSSDGTVIRFLYDRDDLFMELDGAGSPIREYTYYPGIDRPHSVRVTATNTKYYYNMEMPGHVTGLVDGAGTVVNKYDYTPFGSATTATEGVEQPLGYMGRELDRVSGLYYVRARWYDPEQGRFLSEDPIGLAGGMNMYAYVDNNPTNFTDPTGFCRRWIVELTTFYSDGASETHIIGYIWVGCDDQSKSNGGGSGGAGPRDESLTRREHDRLRCVVNGYLVEPARSTFLNMLSQQLVVSGTRSPPAIAWADLPFHGPQRIIFAPGAKGAIASFQPPQLAQTVGHEVRHVYQDQTFSAMFALMGLGRAEYTAFMSSPVVRDWQEADAYAHQNQYVRTDISRSPNCPTLD
jgi:RHS repeat-associated protein